MNNRALGALAWQLSSPFGDAPSRKAATALLADPDVEQTLNGLYPILMDQKSILLMPGHLEAAGADLDELRLATSVVRSTAPLSYRALVPLPDTDTWNISDMADALATQQNLLWASVLDLEGVLDNERFLLLSGRAMETLYPSYQGRLGFDVDLWFPELEGAMRALEVGVANLGFGLRYASVDNPEVEPHLSAGLTKMVDGNEITVGVITGAFHAGRYRRAERPYRGSYAEPLDKRSREITVDGVTLRTPSPEDLLVILSARVRRKKRLQLINMCDAAMILRNSADLNVPLVLELSRRYGLDVELGIVLTCVDARWPGLVTGGLRSLIDQAPRLHVAATKRSTQAAGPVPIRRLETWAFEVTDIHTAQASIWPRAASTWIAREVQKQGVRSNDAIRKLAGRERRRAKSPRGDPLCGVASLDIIGELPRCVGRRSANAWRHRVSDEMKDTADRLVALVGGEGHECWRLWAT